MTGRSRLGVAALLALVAGACSSGGEPITLNPADTTSTTVTPLTGTTEASDVVPTLVVDVADAGADISPLIVGIAGDADAAYVDGAGIALRSWGGETATRYNFRTGDASNGGAERNYQNGPTGLGEAAETFIASGTDAGVDTRLAVPTLGWVASNADPSACSFPLPDGACGNAGGATCLDPGVVADPAATSVPSNADDVAAWIAGLVADPRTTPRFIALDNEPELWGVEHYDVHPACSTYEEILLKYIEYASAIRDVAPDAQLMGPVVCCWFDYWRTAPGPADGSGDDYLGWFLRKVREHDESAGRRTLDIVDVHYSPQADVINDDVDPETSALRLRSTRSLYDAIYQDESWVSTRIRFLPRIRETVEAAYPGTPIAVSEWNWGAGESLNGALAIADVLGIYGREGVYLAAHSQPPAFGSPGYLAFKMHGNYDDQGARFGGRSVRVTAEGVDLYDDLGAYAAFDEPARMLRLMLINKRTDSEIDLALDVRSFEWASTGRLFRYGADDLDAITQQELTLGDQLSIALPPSSITLIEIPGR